MKFFQIKGVLTRMKNKGNEEMIEKYQKLFDDHPDNPENKTAENVETKLVVKDSETVNDTQVLAAWNELRQSNIMLFCNLYVKGKTMLLHTFLKEYKGKRIAKKDIEIRYETRQRLNKTRTF
jgi:hypothetical protein